MVVCVCFMCSQRIIEQLEEKVSRLKEEHVNTKEALNKTQLQKDLVQNEKQEAGEWMFHVLLLCSVLT